MLWGWRTCPELIGWGSWVFQPGEEEAMGDLMEACQGCQEHLKVLFAEVHSRRT